MLIAYTPREWNNTAPTIAISGGAWLTADGGAACVDGKPARKARYNAAGVCTITLTFPTSISIRAVGVLGLAGVAEGAAVNLTSASGNAAGVVRRFSNGSLGCWLVLPVGGALAANAQIALPAGTVDIGELVALPAVEIDHATPWQPEFIDPSESVRTRGSGVRTARRTPYRKMGASFVAAPSSEVRGGGLQNGMDWEQLAAALSGDSRMVAIPRWKTTAGGIDVNESNRTAIYGVGRITQYPHQAANYHTAEFVAEEIPAT